MNTHRTHRNQERNGALGPAATLVSGAAASQPAMRRHNLSLALRTLWDAGRITRTQLAQALDLSKPAITRIVNDLTEAGYVEEHADPLPRGRGRPSTFLTLRSGLHYFIGVDFRVDRMAIQARDLTGAIMSDRHFPVTPGVPITKVIAMLTALIHALTDEIGRRPTGIGVSVPAEIDNDGTTILDSMFFDWIDVPFSSLMQQALGPDYPAIRMDHIASSAAIANWREVSATGASDLIHLQAGIGIGVAYAGRDFPTGRQGGMFRRAGHMPMQPDGPLCRCGAHGCLDAVAGFEALVRYAEPCGLAVGDGSEAMREFCNSLLALDAEGSPVAHDAIVAVGDWLGRAAATIVIAAAPSRMTIGGYPLYLGEAFLGPFLAAIEPFAPGGPDLFTQTSLGDEASVMGAVLLGMHTVMSDPLGSLQPRRPEKVK